MTQAGRVDALVTRGPLRLDIAANPVMEANYILVTPGNPGEVIGQAGDVLYSITSSRGMPSPRMVPHELRMRPFTSTKSP
jgi:hypothetical protein